MNRQIKFNIHEIEQLYVEHRGALQKCLAVV